MRSGLPMSRTPKRRELSVAGDRRALAVVVALVAAGLSNTEIATRLGVSMATVKRDMTYIMLKWDCKNRTAVAVEAVRRSVAPPEAGQG